MIRKTVLFSFFVFFFMSFSAGAEQYGFSRKPLSGSIGLTAMEKFSGLTKDEILKKRSAAVKASSVFGNLIDYRPSESVFQIEDGLPWIGAHEVTCYGVRGSSDIGRGTSRESVGILNPELLFVINMPAFAFHSTTGCSEADYLIPYRAYYDEIGNTISAYIDYSAFYRKNRAFFGIILEDANARDLGYNYVFADKVKNIRFKNSVNFSTEITQTSGFFHRGGSCGADGGCNNYSPYEGRYHFYVNNLQSPVSLHMKLWKERPADPSVEADMNYELIFR